VIGREKNAEMLLAKQTPPHLDAAVLLPRVLHQEPVRACRAGGSMRTSARSEIERARITDPQGESSYIGGGGGGRGGRGGGGGGGGGGEGGG
jgi:hypothetical protein